MTSENYQSIEKTDLELSERLEVLENAFAQSRDKNDRNFTVYTSPIKNEKRPDYLEGYNQIFRKFISRLRSGYEDPRFEIKRGPSGNEYITTPEISKKSDWLDMVAAATKIPKEAGGVIIGPLGISRVKAIYSMNFGSENADGWIRATAGVTQETHLSQQTRFDSDTGKFIEAKHGMLAEDLDANFAGEMTLEVKTIFGKVVGVKLVEISDESGGFIPRTYKDKFNLVLNKLRASGLDIDPKIKIDVQKGGEKLEPKRTNNLKNFENISDANERMVLQTKTESGNTADVSAEKPIFLEFNGAGCFLWVDHEGKPYLSAIAYDLKDGTYELDAYSGGNSATSPEHVWRKKGDKLEMTLGRFLGNSIQVPEGGYRNGVSRNQFKVTYDPKKFSFAIENLSNSNLLNVISLKPKVGK